MIRLDRRGRFVIHPTPGRSLSPGYDAKGIFKVEVATGKSERMPQIPEWGKAYKVAGTTVDMSRDEKSFVMIFVEQPSDIWVVENFDPET